MAYDYWGMVGSQPGGGYPSAAAQPGAGPASSAGFNPLDPNAPFNQSGPRAGGLTLARNMQQAAADKWARARAVSAGRPHMSTADYSASIAAGTPGSGFVTGAGQGGAPFGATGGAGAFGGTQALAPAGGMGMSNPYLADQAGAITNRMTDNMQRNVLPGISYGAQAAGGFGNSRQGVIEANALKDMNQGLGDSLANLYGGAYQFDQGNATNQRGQDMSFYTQQRGQDQTGAALGASLFSQGMSGEFDPLKNASGIYSPYTGLGTSTSNQQSGGGWQGALGGALGAAQLGKNFGWWGN